MKVTLDHNCLIDVEQRTREGLSVLNVVNSKRHQCFVVNIGASELRERGIRPDNYALFEQFLAGLDLIGLARLNPIGLIDISFIGYCVIASAEMVKLANDIENILFPNSIEQDTLIDSPPYHPIGRKRLNQICDVYSMWCHIHYENEIFLTSDENFHKSTKRDRLISLGAANIMKPSEFSE